MSKKFKITVEEEVNGVVTNSVGVIHINCELSSSVLGQDLEIEAIVNGNGNPTVRPKQRPKY